MLRTRVRRHMNISQLQIAVLCVALSAASPLGAGGVLRQVQAGPRVQTHLFDLFMFLGANLGCVSLLEVLQDPSRLHAPDMRCAAIYITGSIQ